MALKKSEPRSKKTKTYKMRPLKLGRSGKAGVRTQFGALCYRKRQEKVQILLITSRNTGRWIVPKGWPMDGETPVQAALTEAWEEAGVKGKTNGEVLGLYSYIKREPGKKMPCVVAVFSVKVARLADNYPEAGQRRRKWFSRKKAANLVGEPELRRIIRSFEPGRR